SNAKLTGDGKSSPAESKGITTGKRSEVMNSILTLTKAKEDARAALLKASSGTERDKLLAAYEKASLALSKAKRAEEDEEEDEKYKADDEDAEEADEDSEEDEEESDEDDDSDSDDSDDDDSDDDDGDDDEDEDEEAKAGAYSDNRLFRLARQV